jgi:hypothetical protein
LAGEWGKRYLPTKLPPRLKSATRRMSGDVRGRMLLWTSALRRRGRTAAQGAMPLPTNASTSAAARRIYSRSRRKTQALPSCSRFRDHAGAGLLLPIAVRCSRHMWRCRPSPRCPPIGARPPVAGDVYRAPLVNMSRTIFSGHLDRPSRPAKRPARFPERAPASTVKCAA